MNHDITLLDLQQLIRVGHLGPLQLGMSRNQVLELLGTPDAEGGTSHIHKRPAILVYSGVEFHFDRETDKLCLIYTDELASVGGTDECIKVDRWILRPEMTVKQVANSLESAECVYQIQQVSDEEGRVRITAGCGVELLFSAQTERGDTTVGLVGFSLSSWHASQLPMDEVQVTND